MQHLSLLLLLLAFSEFATTLCAFDLTKSPWISVNRNWLQFKLGRFIGCKPWFGWSLGSWITNGLLLRQLIWFVSMVCAATVLQHKAFKFWVHWYSGTWTDPDKTCPSGFSLAWSDTCRTWLVHSHKEVYLIALSGAEHFPELLNLVKDQSLYKEALKLYPSDSQEYKVGEALFSLTKSW